MAQSCTKHENHACVVCHVGPRSVWHDLDETARALLAVGRRRREYGSGEVVFVQGEQNDGVHCVSGGTVGIRRLDDNGNSVLLELAYAGDTIGYRSFLTGSEHKTSAEALGPSVVCHIDRAAITALLAGNPALGLLFLKRSIGELEHAHDMMFRQATLSNRHKLVHLLLVLVQRHGRRHSPRDHLSYQWTARDRWSGTLFRPSGHDPQRGSARRRNRQADLGVSRRSVGLLLTH